MARQVLDGLRDQIRDGSLADIPDVAGLVEARGRLLLHGRLRPVINATGVIVHTNLGRAPWPEVAVEAGSSVARSYANLEIDLHTGRRGGRMDAVSALLQFLTGAERGLVVNNCAAAVLLALTALARDREVVVSRGELVEIGGSFRVPDVIESGGARLREVGTTNRTRLSDYANAIAPETAVFLRAHPSNFRVIGFTESTDIGALAELAHANGLHVVDDQGSGSLFGDFGAPAVRDSVGAGVDLVTFSGDKLLGGPQAGFIVGKASVVEKLRKHPLYRALRVDKVTLAAVEATLALHARGDETPVGEMMSMPVETVRERADALCAALGAVDVPAVVVEDQGYVGGGSLPGEAVPTFVVRMTMANLDVVAARLRGGDPAVVGRTAGGALCLDPRTMLHADPVVVAAAVALAVHAR
jgi:L-seryl-tRNA(Ser) seleniumtransferase